jgi:hypothetical protein
MQTIRTMWFDGHIYVGRVSLHWAFNFAFPSMSSTQSFNPKVFVVLDGTRRGPSIFATRSVNICQTVDTLVNNYYQPRPFTASGPGSSPFPIVVQLESRQDADEVATLNMVLGKLYNRNMSIGDAVNAIYQSEEFSSALAHRWIFYAIAGGDKPCICCSWYVLQPIQVCIL